MSDGDGNPYGDENLTDEDDARCCECGVAVKIGLVSVLPTFYEREKQLYERRCVCSLCAERLLRRGWSQETS